MPIFPQQDKRRDKRQYADERAERNQVLIGPNDGQRTLVPMETAFSDWAECQASVEPLWLRTTKSLSGI